MSFDRSGEMIRRLPNLGQFDSVELRGRVRLRLRLRRAAPSGRRSTALGVTPIESTEWNRRWTQDASVSSICRRGPSWRFGVSAS